MALARLRPLRGLRAIARRAYSTALEVPVIDLAGSDAAVASEVASACEEWGFFQVVNHGVDAGVTLFALCAFMASFSLGMGPVTWVVVSEIFPLEHRAKGTAVSMAVNRLTSGTVAMTFLSLSDFVGVGGAFLFFSGVSATHFAFTFRYLPETKGKSLEEIEASLGSGASGGGAYARLDEADER